MATPAQAQAQAKLLELQQRHQTLTVLESELSSLKADARIFHATSTSLDPPSIPHSHGELVLFPSPSREGALNDVKRQKQVVSANLKEATGYLRAMGEASKSE